MATQEKAAMPSTRKSRAIFRKSKDPFWKLLTLNPDEIDYEINRISTKHKHLKLSMTLSDIADADKLNLKERENMRKALNKSFPGAHQKAHTKSSFVIRTPLDMRRDGTYRNRKGSQSSLCDSVMVLPQNTRDPSPTLHVLKINGKTKDKENRQKGDKEVNRSSVDSNDGRRTSKTKNGSKSSKKKSPTRPGLLAPPKAIGSHQRVKSSTKPHRIVAMDIYNSLRHKWGEHNSDSEIYSEIDGVNESNCDDLGSQSTALPPMEYPLIIKSKTRKTPEDFNSRYHMSKRGNLKVKKHIGLIDDEEDSDCDTNILLSRDPLQGASVSRKTALNGRCDKDSKRHLNNNDLNVTNQNSTLNPLTDAKIMKSKLKTNHQVPSRSTFKSQDNEMFSDDKRKLSHLHAELDHKRGDGSCMTASHKETNFIVRNYSEEGTFRVDSEVGDSILESKDPRITKMYKRTYSDDDPAKKYKNQNSLDAEIEATLNCSAVETESEYQSDLKRFSSKMNLNELETETSFTAPSTQDGSSVPSVGDLDKTAESDIGNQTDVSDKSSILSVPETTTSSSSLTEEFLKSKADDPFWKMLSLSADALEKKVKAKLNNKHSEKELKHCDTDDTQTATDVSSSVVTEEKSKETSDLNKSFDSDSTLELLDPDLAFKSFDGSDDFDLDTPRNKSMSRISDAEFEKAMVLPSDVLQSFLVETHYQTYLDEGDPLDAKEIGDIIEDEFEAPSFSSSISDIRQKSVANSGFSLKLPSKKLYKDSDSMQSSELGLTPRSGLTISTDISSASDYFNKERSTKSSKKKVSKRPSLIKEDNIKKISQISSKNSKEETINRYFDQLDTSSDGSHVYPSYKNGSDWIDDVIEDDSMSLTSSLNSSISEGCREIIDRFKRRSYGKKEKTPSRRKSREAVKKGSGFSTSAYGKTENSKLSKSVTIPPVSPFSAGKTSLSRSTRGQPKSIVRAKLDAYFGFPVY